LLNLVDSDAGSPSLCESVSDWAAIAFDDGAPLVIDCDGDFVQLAIAPDLSTAELLVTERS
jgi:hypothetical protein